MIPYLIPSQSFIDTCDFGRTTTFQLQIGQSMVLLDNEAFLSQLTYLYNKTRTSGTVWVTMKAYYGRTKPIPRGKKKDKSALLEMEGSESKCLVRATNGKKKISTVGNIALFPSDVNNEEGNSAMFPSDVTSIMRCSRGYSYVIIELKLQRQSQLSILVNTKDVNRFQQAYSSVLKASLDNLKKRERKTAKSKKAKATQ